MMSEGAAAEVANPFTGGNRTLHCRHRLRPRLPSMSNLRETRFAALFPLAKLQGNDKSRLDIAKGSLTNTKKNTRIK